MTHAITVAEFITHHVEASPKTQKRIAEEAGFPRSNVLSMIKTGETKMPLARVPALAAALGVDELEFLSLCLKEYEPDVWSVIKRHLKTPHAEPAEMPARTVHAFGPGNEAPSPHPGTKLSRALSFVLHSGIEVFPCMMQNSTTGKLAFRVSPGGKGGNTLAASQEVSEAEMLEKVLEHGWAVRCKPLGPGAPCSLYKVGQRAVADVRRS